ncbi:MAG: hypothetical protein IPM56_06380 [Ignavibacteriales bacterium]|nr:MAG: hypothetical protein IPM56_06380 [Ignavibacteriales bacterium]
MKYLNFCLALLSAAVFTACQENPIMDNPQNDTQQNFSINKTPSTENTIKLDVLLQDPTQGFGQNLYYILTGNIIYTLHHFPDHTAQYQDFENTTLKIKIDARLLKPADQDLFPNFTIRAESFDRFNIPSNGARSVFITKKYKIYGFPKVYLSCMYEVTRSSVSIKEIKLCCSVFTPHANVSQY